MFRLKRHAENIGEKLSAIKPILRANVRYIVRQSGSAPARVSRVRIFRILGIPMDGGRTAAENLSGQIVMPELETPFRLPESCIDRKALKRLVLDALSGDFSFHQQIKDALVDAGFRVTRVRKHEIHHVWELRLEKGALMLRQTDAQIRRRIRQVFRAEGLYCKAEGIEIGIQGRRIICGFICRLGKTGFI